MNGKTERYIIEQLAFTGFCLLDSKIAYELRRDIWATVFNARGDFVRGEILKFLSGLPGVMLLEIQLEGSDGWAIVAFRSQGALMERIEQITGFKAIGMRPLTELRPMPAAVVDSDPNPLPNYPCVERTERLLAAGIKDDPSYKQPPRFAPKRSSL